VDHLNVGFRRISPVAAHSGDRLLSEPTAGDLGREAVAAVAGRSHADTLPDTRLAPDPVSVTMPADAFLQRLGERQVDRDTAVSDQTVQAQLTAIAKWARRRTRPKH
jgi:hypothetical protein